jgi:hypothetical protein
MKLTPEQKVSNREQAKRILAEKMDRLPAARIDDTDGEYGVVIEIEAGTTYSLKVSTRGKGHVNHDHDNWMDFRLRLNDMESLALFIGALIGRYNDNVIALNRAAATIKPLGKINEVAQ